MDDQRNEDAPADETFVNPLAQETGGLPVDLGPGEPTSPASDPDGTARMAVGVADWLVTMKWDSPLSEKEQADLQADLGAVLAKHDVPNLPFHEELKLSMTMGGIVFRRAVAAREQREAAPQDSDSPHPKAAAGGPNVNYPGSGQKREWEVRAVTQDMFCRTADAGGAVLP